MYHTGTIEIKHVKDGIPVAQLQVSVASPQTIGAELVGEYVSRVSKWHCVPAAAAAAAAAAAVCGHAASRHPSDLNSITFSSSAERAFGPMVAGDSLRPAVQDAERVCV